MERGRAANGRVPSYAYAARVRHPTVNKSQSASDGWMRPGRDARIRARLIETLGSGWNPGISHPFEACRYLKRSSLPLAGYAATTASHRLLPWPRWQVAIASTAFSAASLGSLILFWIFRSVGSNSSFVSSHAAKCRQVSVSVSMSDEEHHFDSKADAGASKTYPQQAGTIRKNGYIVIKGRACKVDLYSIRFHLVSVFCCSLICWTFWLLMNLGRWSFVGIFPYNWLIYFLFCGA